MAESEKLKRITKGIREDAFQLIVVKAPSSVPDLVELCKTLQDARHTRVRLPQTSPTSASPDLLQGALKIEPLQTIIRNVVREELVHSGLPTTPPVQPISDSAIRAAVNQEVATAMSSTASIQPSYAAISTDPSPAQPTSYVTAVSLMTPPMDHPQIQPFQNRSEISAPVCYYSGLRGHFSQVCRKRQREQHLYWQIKRYSETPSISYRPHYYNSRSRSPYRHSEHFGYQTQMNANRARTTDDQQ